MAETPSKIHYPTGEDLYQPHTDMEQLARDVRHIIPVANATERNSLASDYSPSPAKPLYVDRADTDTVERNVGSGWKQIYPAVLDDTGWQSSAFALNSAHFTGDIELRRKNGIVYGNGTLTRKSGYIGSNWVTLGTIQSGYRPARTKYLSSNGSGVFIQMQISSDGTCQARQLSTTDQPVNIVFDPIIFPVD